MKKKILEYFHSGWHTKAFLIFLSIIYFNNETLANNLCTFIDQPCLIVSIIAIFFFLLSKQKMNCYNNKGLVVCIIFIVCLIFNGLFDSNFSNGYYLTIMNVIVAYILSSKIMLKDFTRWYILITCILAICSLIITYPLSPIIRTLPFPHVVNSSYIPFVNAIVCYIVDIDGYIRNTGIFREAGVWGAFLIIAQIFLVVNKKEYSPKKFIILFVLLSITIFSTFSTACMIAYLLFIIIAITKKDFNIGHNKLTILLLVTMLLFALKNADIFEIFGESVDKVSTDSSSYQARTNVYANAFDLISSNIFGHGIINGTKGLMEGQDERIFHNTSTILTTCVYFGIPYFLLYSIGLFMFCKKRLGNILYFIPVLLLINAQQYIFNPIFYMLIFYGFQKLNKYRQNNESTMDNQCATTRSHRIDHK